MRTRSVGIWRDPATVGHVGLLDLVCCCPTGFSKNQLRGFFLSDSYNPFSESISIDNYQQFNKHQHTRRVLDVQRPTS